jgi:membrane peptidoglycan carboxypeptidase
LTSALGVTGGVAVAALLAAAWVESPTGAGLQAHVRVALGRAGGRAVSASMVAPILRDAIVATEDERFYQHHGIDIVGVLRALPYDLAHFSFAQGASTITEQVAKGLFLGGNDRNPWRKLEDAAVALKLENRYSKEQILTAYLNTAYFGAGATGIRAASERYFGVSPRQLTTAQASLLAGLPQAPSSYDPFLHPEAGRDRQIDVLRALVRNGYLTQEEATAALARPLHLESGASLQALRGIDLTPGPAFVWWQLSLGAALALAGAVALVASRLPRLRTTHGLLVLRIASLIVVVVGIGTAVRAFRVA